MSKNTRTRILLTAIAALLLVTMAVGGTLAWLVDDTDKITNTFSTSDVGVELEETKGTYDEETKTYDFKMIPGHMIQKDPTVKLTAGSEESYVFVEITESANFDDYMGYDLADGWTVLDIKNNSAENDTYIIWRTMTAGEEKAVLANNQVTVHNGVTKADMEAAKTNVPTIEFKAYAVQKNYMNDTPFTPAQAWSAVSNPTDDPTIVPTT